MVGFEEGLLDVGLGDDGGNEVDVCVDQGRRVGGMHAG